MCWSDDWYCSWLCRCRWWGWHFANMSSTQPNQHHYHNYQCGLNNTVTAKSQTENRNVLRRCLKTASDGADVIWADRSFQTAVSETENVRLSTVERRTSGRCRRSEQDELSRRNGMSATRVKQNWRYLGPVPWMARYFKTANLKKCAQTHAANEGWWVDEWCVKNKEYQIWAVQNCMCFMGSVSK